MMSRRNENNGQSIDEVMSNPSNRNAVFLHLTPENNGSYFPRIVRYLEGDNFLFYKPPTRGDSQPSINGFECVASQLGRRGMFFLLSNNMTDEIIQNINDYGIRKEGVTKRQEGGKLKTKKTNTKYKKVNSKKSKKIKK